MLQMEAVQDVNLKDWLKRKENVYTSPDIQNEVIKLIASENCSWFNITYLRGNSLSTTTHGTCTIITLTMNCVKTQIHP